MKKTGFTLAEVLITLGIIGVVAAMTIPTLIANTNSSKFASQFKKSMSTLNQAALMATAQNDTDYGTLDGKNAAGTVACLGNHSLTGGDNSVCALFNSTLAGATFVSSISTLKANNTTYSPTFSALTGKTVATAANAVGYQMADGSLVVVPSTLAGCTRASDQPLSSEGAASGYTGTKFLEAKPECIGYIDVNGPTLPNKEVTCGTGSTETAAQLKPEKICTVGKDTKHMTDIYPVVFYDQTVEPATDAAKAVLTGATTSGTSTGSGS